MKKEFVVVLMLIAGFCSAQDYNDSHLKNLMARFCSGDYNDSCLQEIAFNPLGINVGQMRSIGPEGIRKIFGAPRDTMIDTTSHAVCYRYRDKEISFMGNSVFFLEIYGGKVGCLRIGMSKDRFEEKFGPIFSLDSAGYGIEIKTYYDEYGKRKFKLNIEFRNNKIVRIIPDLGEAFEL